MKNPATLRGADLLGGDPLPYSNPSPQRQRPTIRANSAMRAKLSAWLWRQPWQREAPHG